MRACHSGGAFAMAFERETQQAFLEAHVHAFDWFGGVFALVRYDNLKAAVAKILKGRRRVESDRFVALRSHYLFESRFTLRREAGRPRKGRRGGRGRPLPPPPPRAGARGSEPCRAQRADRRRGRRGSEAHDQGPLRDRRAGALRPRALSCARCPPRRSTRASRPRRGSTQRRWSRSARTATRSRSRSWGARCS